jgi:hypothetical protein
MAKSLHLTLPLGVLLLLAATRGYCATLPPEGNLADTFAQYSPGLDNPPANQQPHPGFATSSAVAGPGTANPISFSEPVLITRDEARAEARSSSLPGNIGSSSLAAGGFSGFGAPTVLASAIATQITHWREHSRPRS